MNRSYLFNILQQKKTLVIGGGVVVLLCIAIGIATLILQSHERRGKIAVEVATVPRDAEITLNEQRIQQGTAYLAPGTYEAKVQKEGFAPYVATLQVSQHATRPLYAALRPESEQATKWAARNQQAYAKLERLAAESSATYGKAFQAKWPIVKTLPIKDPYFTISYVHHNDETISLKISGTSPRYRMLALQHLRSRGFDPTEYKIEFVGFTNPLEDKGAHRE